MRNLIFFGAGGHALDITHIVEEINKIADIDFQYNIVGYLSDDENYFNNKFSTIGNFESIKVLSKVFDNLYFVIAINSSAIREEVFNKYCKSSIARPALLIHPSVEWSGRYMFARDSDIVIGPMTYIAPGTEIGSGTHINSGVTINQGCEIGKFVTISPGVNICGDVTIKDGVQFGAGGVVINYKEIGENAIVGSGSVVIDNVSPNTTVVGVPAKPIKANGQIVWG